MPVITSADEGDVDTTPQNPTGFQGPRRESDDLPDARTRPVNVKEDTSLPLDDAFQFILRGELKGEVEPKSSRLLLELVEHAPSVSSRRALAMRGMALPSFISFEWKGGFWKGNWVWGATKYAGWGFACVGVSVCY